MFISLSRFGMFSVIISLNKLSPFLSFLLLGFHNAYIVYLMVSHKSNRLSSLFHSFFFLLFL
jgi:hypothetical protein